MVPLLQTHAMCLFPTSKLLSSETHEICFNVNKEVLVFQIYVFKHILIVIFLQSQLLFTSDVTFGASFNSVHKIFCYLRVCSQVECSKQVFLNIPQQIYSFVLPFYLFFCLFLSFILFIILCLSLLQTVHHTE